MLDWLSPATLSVWLIALPFGLAAALVAWLLTRSMAQVPNEDRQYKDRPPAGFRLLWWPIQWIAHYIEPRLSESKSEALAIRLRQAGMDYTLSPAQFIGTRYAGAIVCALLGAYLITLLMPASKLLLQISACCAVFGWLYPAIWLRDRIAVRRRELLKALPFYLDLITLCVEAGLNFQGAVNQAVNKGPETPLRHELQRVLRDIRAGKARADSLRSMAERLDEASITSFVGTVIQAENMGMNLAPVLRAQADQRRSERFLRAEKQAMEAPVKMLFPLIAFIFPCTFIVLLYPIIMQLLEAGF